MLVVETFIRYPRKVALCIGSALAMSAAGLVVGCSLGCLLCNIVNAML